MTDRDELRRLLVGLPAARLQPDDWDEVERRLAELDRGGGDVEALGSVIFEAQVRGRFAGPRATAGLQPTKQTSVLPWVGLVCGGVLVAVGALLGGGLILVGIAALGIFVFGIAWAGSNVAHRRDEERADVEPSVPIPDPVALLVAELRQGTDVGSADRDEK